MRNYTLKQLQTFLQVAQEGSISRVAQKQGVSQPSVSMLIRQFEEILGLPLLEADGRNIRLTIAGQDVLTYAQAAAAQLRDMESVAAEHIGLLKGVIKLAVVSTAKYFAPMLLANFSKAYPGIEIKLQVEDREKVLTSLLNNEADLIITGHKGDAKLCDASPFSTNPMGIIASPEHPLACKKHIAIKELENYPFVVREMGTGTRTTMERLFTQHEISPKIAMEMPSTETIKQAVMVNMGLSFISLRTVRHEIAGGYISLLDVCGMPIVGNWYVINLKSRRLCPATLGFKKFLCEQGAKLIDAWA